MYRAAIRGAGYRFETVREVLAKAGEEKSGDQLAGIAAESERERVAAKWVLSEMTLREIVDSPVIDPAVDEVSRMILERQDRAGFAAIADFTVGAFRDYLLDDEMRGAELAALHGSITPEIAAAVAKLMGNKDLVIAASKIRVVTRCRNTMGERGVFGVRIQPNHPSDDLGGILLSTIDGLLFGCGDAVIGVNPAGDSADTVASILQTLDRLITELEIPTQACCLAHMTTQLAALERGAPIDLLFQSVAGTEAANRSFGIDLGLLAEGRARVLESRAGRGVSWAGPQVMYFETGQGSALSSCGCGSTHARGSSAVRSAIIRSLPGEQRGRLHRPRVSPRRAADHPRRAGGSFRGQAARSSDGLRRVPHQPRPSRREFGRQSLVAPRRRGVQFRDGSSLIGRCHAQ
jgi:ethanolamine ammonia-lyase large subunit